MPSRWKSLSIANTTAPVERSKRPCARLRHLHRHNIKGLRGRHHAQRERLEVLPESGVALVLVLVFLLVGSLVVWSLANLAANDLQNTGNFAKARSL